MQKCWTGKNVDLALLANCISDFFKEKDFEVTTMGIQTGYQILAEASPHFKLIGYLTATIKGNPDDFTVKFDFCKEEAKHPRLSPFLLSMFGGGSLLLRELKSQEVCLKMEKEFWKYVENTILHLTYTEETATRLSK